MRFFHLSVPLPSGFAARVAVFYAALCAVIGVQLPFFPLWLKAKGLDAQTIGLVLAVPMLVRVAAIPVASRFADRRDALRNAIILCSLATAIGYVLLGLSHGVIAIFLSFALASAAYTPIMPLAETYALRGLAARGGVYGPVRLWGSAAFVLGTFAAGLAADLLPARDLIWLILVAVLLNAAAAFALEPVSVTAADTPHGKPGKSLLRDPGFAVVLLAASLIQASHAVYYGFSTLGWSRAGLDGTTIAALWALGVIAEIVLFALQGRLPFTPVILLALGGGGAVLRWLAMAFDPPALLLPLLQLLHGLSFGATHLGALGFVARRAQPGQAAAVHGHLASALGIVMAGSMGLSGWLYGSFGNLSYAAMALVAAAGGVGALVANKLGRDAPR
ncbi:MAG: MFS transporter [Pseudolabrys sp.]